MSFLEYENYKPGHLSYSSMDNYRSCGMRFRLQRIDQVEQKPGLAGLGGNAVHTATEWYDLAPADGEGAWMGAEFAFREAWDQEVEKRRKDSPNYSIEDYTATGRAGAEYGGRQNIQWWMDNGPKMVQSWIDWRQNSGFTLWETPDGKPAVEVSLKPVLPNDVPVLQFIDRIMVSPAGQLTVVDLKTGRIPETAEQLGLYAWAIGEMWGEMFRPDWGYFWSPSKGHGTPQDLSMYTADYFTDLSNGVIAGVEAGCFLAKPANGCARWCGVAKNCPAVGGKLPAKK